MNIEDIRLYVMLGIALLLVIYTISRRKARNAKRAKDAAAQRFEVLERLKELDSRLEGEIVGFEAYNERLERQRQLIERCNSKHKDN